GVMVTVIRLDTGQSRRVTTGEDGSYKLNLLPPGNYSVRIEVAGFKAVEVPSVKVNITATAVLDRRLEVGAPTEAVRAEAEIQTSSYAAGYGRNPGANVNVVTKSGTNSFHGSAFEFFRNTVLNANTWFRNYQGLPKPVLNSNQYGGAFGGPIKKDKLFFFASYQETGQKNGLTGYGAASATAPPIPTGNRGKCPPGWTTLSQCDSAGQAFVPVLAAAISPQAPCNRTGNQNNTTSNGGIQVQCPNGTVSDPSFNINPVAISLLQLQFSDGRYLVPSSGMDPGGPNSGYALQNYSIPAIFKDHNGMGNFDYLINSKHTLAGRYQYERDTLQAPFPFQNALQTGNFVPC